MLMCENKGREGGCRLSVGDLCCKCEVINCGQPVYIASLAQHVVVTRAMWIGTELFPPFIAIKAILIQRR